MNAQTFDYRIALAKYKGGGDWYANPTSLPNLVKYCNQHLATNIHPEIAEVELGSAQLFNYPFLHLTGHGNVYFDEQDVSNLRNYLLAGGFLHIDDNYGLDEFIRREMKKVFPEENFAELPPDFPIFHAFYSFTNGLPKIHEHDGKPAQAFGIFLQGRLAVLYTYESDLGDGWEDEAVHNDPESKRIEALKMGANILTYAFTQQ
jgi:hypothetical protein